jgi:hypothetical protein
VFTVAKSDGGFRLCTDYRELNKFSEKQKFQMEGVQEVAQLIQKDDYGMLVDLKDAYLTLGLHPSHRKYCRFRCPSTRVRYQWKTVSFGTSEAPKICTKILRPLIGILKSLGVRCLIYIDDLLLLDQDPVRLARSMAIAMELLQKQALQSSARRLLKMSVGAPVPTRDLARFVGQVVSTSRAIRPAKRRLLHIQHALAKAVRRQGWNGRCTLSQEVRRALEWWVTEEPWKANGNCIVQPVRPIQVSLRTDAATHNAGYGGVMIRGSTEFRTRGFLTDEERAEVFINQYEFSGFENPLWALLPEAVPDRNLWKHVHVSVELDNVTSIKYGRVAVSRSIRMSRMGARFFDKVEEVGLSLSFRHLAGEKNVEADGLSRQPCTHADWKLNKGLFSKIGKVLGASPVVDLFASSQNAQLPTFFSYNNFDHRAKAADAFLHRWSELGVLYAYPPANPSGEVSPAVTCRLLSTFDSSTPRLDGADVVSDATGDASGTPTPSSERRVVGDRPAGSAVLASSMASHRMRFIWHFGSRKGIEEKVFTKRWGDSKNGYPHRYDAHFDKFRGWWGRSHPTTELSPANIRPGLLASYLTELSTTGIHHDTLRDVSTSISMACVEASDQQYQPGKSFTVSKLFEGERRRRPVRRAGTGEYADMALLYEEMWRYGPSSAMTVGQKKKRIVVLLAADSAARPSGIAKLFRKFDSWQQQIVFTSWGVKIRFFYTKEIVPGSARDNATGYWFTTWVNEHKEDDSVNDFNPGNTEGLSRKHLRLGVCDAAHSGNGHRLATTGFCQGASGKVATSFG